jgi:L-lactate dehydrogenase complex protein LldG
MDERAFIDRFRRDSRRCPHPGAYPAPPYAATWQRFAQVLQVVGGRFFGPLGGADLRAAIVEGIAGAKGRVVASVSAAPLLAGVTGWASAADGAERPHGLDDTDLGILTAELAVAENAALLLSSTSLRERALAFLAQHLLVLVPASSLLPDLITAQARLPNPPPHNLTWMSGPSKTADIEQTLVIGAHGARSLTVIAYQV